MTALLYTVQDIVDQVRNQTDEQNRDSVSTENDILPSINRAQDFAFDILARVYEEPILAYRTLDLSSGAIEYDIPEDVFEDRIQKMEVAMPTANGTLQSFREMQRISYRDLTLYESATRTNVPYYYCIIGRRIRIIPPPSGIYNIRMWYLRNPEKLVIPQGRITIVNTASNYVVLDSAGDSLTTEADQLGSYVNVIDGQTGEIKGSLQIQILAENRVTFRTVPTRSSVLNRTISGGLSDLEIAQDDYLSPIDGTCVPYYGKPISNFLIQFAVAEISRKLGGQADQEEKVLEKFERQVERTWTGRETSLRVKKRSQNWGIPINRWWTSNFGR